MNMHKKASIVIMLFIVAALMGLLFVGSLQLNQRSGAVQTEVVEQGFRGTMGSAGELFKNYGFHSFTYSSTMGAFDSGEAGAGRDFWHAWSCDNTPSVSESNQKIQDFATENFNRYMTTIENETTGTSYVSESSKIDEAMVWVTEEDVAEPPLGIPSTGPVDERFIVSGRTVANSSEEVQMVSSLGDEERSYAHAYTIEIWPLRYWYLWRRMRTWAQELFVPDATCGAMTIVQQMTTDSCYHCGMPGPLSIATERAILQEGVDQLEAMFDGQVTCEYELPEECFHSEDRTPQVAPFCEYGCATTGCTYIQTDEPCETWVVNDPDVPNDPYGLRCGSETASPCTAEYQSDYEGGPCYDEDYSEPQVCHGLGKWQFANFRYMIRCTDHKYQNPVSTAGMQNYFLEIWGHVAWDHRVGPPWPCAPPP